MVISNSTYYFMRCSAFVVRFSSSQGAVAAVTVKSFWNNWLRIFESGRSYFSSGSGRILSTIEDSNIIIRKSPIPRMKERDRGGIIVEGREGIYVGRAFLS